MKKSKIEKIRAEYSSVSQRLIAYRRTDEYKLKMWNMQYVNDLCRHYELEKILSELITDEEKSRLKKYINAIK